MAKEPVVIAVDLGGTNLRWALLDRQGKILGRHERTTASMPDQEALIHTLAEELLTTGKEAFFQGAEVQAVGLGIPGRILPAEGIVAFSPNIPYLNDCPLGPNSKNCFPGQWSWKMTPICSPWGRTGWAPGQVTDTCWA